MIDTNVYVSRWPARRLPADDTPALLEKLQAHGVTQAWVGSFDALLHRDVEAVNDRLAEACQRKQAVALIPFGTVNLVPFGTVNPTLPDWEEDLRRCHEVHRMPGIRLHPNYHGYKLDDPLVARLMKLAADQGFVVQLAARLEDPRTQHRLLSVPDVDLTPLVKLLPDHPHLRVQLLNALSGLRPDLLDQLIAAGHVTVEIATLEGVAGIDKLLTHVPLERVLFGSYCPFFAWEAAELKLRESSLGEGQRLAITQGNAEKWWPESSVAK